MINEIPILQNKKNAIVDCLVWRGTYHFNICAEDIISKKSNGDSLNHLIQI